MIATTILGGVSKDTAKTMIEKYTNKPAYNIHYHAWPQLFSNTGGPFSKVGGIYGHAMTFFTLEAYSNDKYAVIFCDGKILDIVDNFESTDYNYVRNTVCQAKQHSDQMICKCGAEWDVNDFSPPKCNFFTANRGN